MSEESSSVNEYYQYPEYPPAPAPSPSPAPTTTPTQQKPRVTSDTYCLYTTQGQVICSKKADKLAIAPWGNEK